MSLVRNILSKTARTTMVAAHRVIIGGAILLIGLLAIVTTFVSPHVAPSILGVLLIVCGVIQAVHALLLNDRALRRSTLFGSVVSLITGGLLAGWGELVFNALALFLGASWLADGVVKLITAT